MNNFMRKFKFKPENSLMIGVERECFLTDLNGNIVPMASAVLSVLNDADRFGYELSACQLEDRIGPCDIDDVRARLLDNDVAIHNVVSKLGLGRSYVEVAPENMPLDVYPDPTGRYQRIVKALPNDILLAACRVIGVHVHVGMPNPETALRVYNEVISRLNYLCREGDGSGGERLRIYREMAPDCISRTFSDWGEFHQYAVEMNFSDDPRQCWFLIRISVHGTIEFRMFGATSVVDRVERWTRICHDICRNAM
ncbi:glutamate-cysteine ligase family protein [Patescibacteria group bacterium]